MVVTFFYMSGKAMFELTGTVERIIFRNEKNGYSVLELSNEDETAVAVGTMPGVGVGESLKLFGTLKTHPNFGEQFSVETFERIIPTTTVSILKYLSSGAIKGIGPATAKKLVEVFKEETLEIIKNAPERLTIIKGINPDKARKISEEFRNLFGIKELMSYLANYSVTPDEAVRVWKKLAENSLTQIKINPYAICADPMNISFEKADKIANALQKPQDDILRVRAAVAFVLNHNMNNGHTCLPKSRLEEATAQFLNVGLDLVQKALDALLKEGSLLSESFDEKEFVFLNKMYDAEIYSANRLLMMSRFPATALEEIDSEIDLIENTHNMQYAELQKEAIKKALEKGILILTGGPGTGKTTTLNAIINILEKKGKKVFLAAPTGRAAKRMSELTKKEAKTIHRMLEVEWDTEDKATFRRNEKNLLKCDALVLDELSMIDVTLFASVLKALPLGARLIMVGDSDQLPSVGAGNVLADLIKSEVLPVVELKEIFRQSMKSLIVMNAHRIVNGEMPELGIKNSDFFFLNIANKDMIKSTICDLCKTRLPRTYGYSPLADIQVLCPGRKGDLGTASLNIALQEVLNPASAKKQELNVNGSIFRVGDKVMQIKNNYDIPYQKLDNSMGQGVFNGDIGLIEGINKIDSSIEVRFDDRLAHYSSDVIFDLELAYAATVHKSQGSEFPVVIMPMYYGAPQLYYRNLLYTAVTRAKSLLILVGNEWVVKRMVENDKKTRRYSGLKEFLLRN